MPFNSMTTSRCFLVAIPINSCFSFRSVMPLVSVVIPTGTDPFSSKNDDKDNTKIHVRVQQRNGRKCITTVQGLGSDLDLKKIARALKKTFQCNGSVTVDEDMGEILQLSGDQRTNIRAFFVDQEVCHEDQIVIHGG
jgi:translation initiation factor 1